VSEPRDHYMSACLLAAFQPIENKEPKLEKGSRGINQALSRLDRQADMLIEEIRGRLPFHDTLHDVIDRMGVK
jgi:hypothetical protein